MTAFLVPVVCCVVCYATLVGLALLGVPPTVPLSLTIGIATGCAGADAVRQALEREP